MSIRKDKGTLLPSAARTTSPPDINISSADHGVSTEAMTNMHIIIDVTAVTLTPSVQPELVTVDPVSGKEYDLLGSIAAITAVGTTVLKLGKDMVPAAGLAAQDFIPELVRLKLTHADADSITYSVGIVCEYDSYK